MENNDLVIQTELELIKAQFPVKETESSYQSCACDWSDQVKSHVVFLKPGANSIPIYASCEHVKYCVQPYEFESYSWVDELTHNGFTNASMILKNPTVKYEADSDLSLSKMESVESWDNYFKAKFQNKNPFENREMLMDFIAFSSIRKGTFEGDWYLFRKADQILGRIGVFAMKIQGIKVARLQDVEIVPSQQGKGYGVQLLSHILKLAQNLNPEQICLCCDDQRGLPKFYTKVGFEQVGRWRIFPLPQV